MENWFPSTLVKDTIHEIRWVADAFCLPVTVAFSGGKDSIVLLDLVRKSGVYHSAHYNLTTVDPPELVRFIRTNYPDVKINHPKLTMWQLIVKKRMPPTRIIRYCCQLLKENFGEGLVLTGVRKEESASRKKKSMIGVLKKTKVAYRPIFHWREDFIWKYIEENNLKYPSLYDEDGIHRIGCIGCPMTGRGRIKQFERWPKYKEAYIRAFQRAIDKRLKDQKSNTKLNYLGTKVKWTTGQEMFDWWMKQ